MSLKAFHVVFVALALLLAGYLGWWALGEWRDGAGGGWLALAVGCVVAMAALAVYGVWFLNKTRGVSFLALVLALAQAWPAAACPVCYGEAEDPVIAGTRWSVAFLGGLVYLLFGGAAGIVFAQRRKLRRLADEPPPDPRNGLHLVPSAPERPPGNEPTDRRS